LGFCRRPRIRGLGLGTLQSQAACQLTEPVEAIERYRPLSKRQPAAGTFAAGGASFLEIATRLP
jgi:hypothetical protein